MSCDRITCLCDHFNKRRGCFYQFPKTIFISGKCKPGNHNQVFMVANILSLRYVGVKWLFFLVLHLLTNNGSNETFIYSSCLWDINNITRRRKRKKHRIWPSQLKFHATASLASSSYMFCFPRCGHVAQAGGTTMSFMPEQHVQKLYATRFWTGDWLRKHMLTHLLTHGRPHHPRGSWWFPSPPMCVMGCHSFATNKEGICFTSHGLPMLQILQR